MATSCECSRYALWAGVAAVALSGGVPTLSAQEAKQPVDWLRPRALRPGDTILFVAPAAPIDLEPVRKYAKQLEDAGHKGIIPKGIERRDHYLAGTEEERAKELNAGLKDPKVRAIFPCRGGYGVTRILDRIGFSALRQDPKIITGFSDLTALHLAVARKARVITFHSPMPMRDLWRQDKEFAFAAQSFRRAVFADQYPKGGKGYEIELPPGRPLPTRLVGGKAQGRLVGGNLTLISVTLGTPYAIEAKGNILFLEDTGEAPYRVDRILSQLRLAGVLAGIKGVVVGQFTKTDAKEVDRVLRDYFAKRKIPVLLNYPVGHTSYNTTLPHGALVELDGDNGTLRVLEDPVRLD